MSTSDPLSKTVGQSAVNDYARLIFETDINARGTVFGGRIMEIADMLAGIVALRHTGMDCVTLSADSVKFLHPAVKGEILVFKASVNRAWTTSMEIGVKVYAQNTRTQEDRHICKAYFTFVGIGEDGKPAKIPRIVPETTDEKRRFEEAQIRRERRLAEDREKQNRV